MTFKAVHCGIQAKALGAAAHRTLAVRRKEQHMHASWFSDHLLCTSTAQDPLPREWRHPQWGGLHLNVIKTLTDKPTDKPRDRPHLDDPSPRLPSQLIPSSVN